MSETKGQAQYGSFPATGAAHTADPCLDDLAPAEMLPYICHWLEMHL